jgi:hypothetical protein
MFYNPHRSARLVPPNLRRLRVSFWPDIIVVSHKSRDLQAKVAVAIV